MIRVGQIRIDDDSMPSAEAMKAAMPKIKVWLVGIHQLNQVERWSLSREAADYDATALIYDLWFSEMTQENFNIMKNTMEECLGPP